MGNITIDSSDLTFGFKNSLIVSNLLRARGLHAIKTVRWLLRSHLLKCNERNSAALNFFINIPFLSLGIQPK
jgi:hypothetical protein